MEVVNRRDGEPWARAEQDQVAEHKPLAGTEHAVAQMNQVHTARAPLGRTKQAVQRPLAGPAQGIQQAQDKLPGTDVESWPFSSWEHIWVPGLAEHQLSPPMEQVQVQKWTGSQLPSPWKLLQGPTGHQLLPPEELVQVQRWTGSQLALAWEPGLLQGPTGHQPLPPEEQVWVQERAMSNLLGELEQGPSQGGKTQPVSKALCNSVCIYVFMYLWMQVGEQNQSFDSPAHIHSKQSSKRIIQGPQK